MGVFSLAYYDPKRKQKKAFKDTGGTNGKNMREQQEHT